MNASVTAMLPWGITALAFSLLLWQGWQQRRRTAQLELRYKQRLDDLGREMHAIGSGSMGVGRRVMACEQSLLQLAGALEEMRQNDPLRVSYDEASKLVELGANTDDLMNSCGISRPEAELVTALRRRTPGDSSTDYSSSMHSVA
ncbi:MAG: DUF2802 domain-containing protein [Halomonadaceae bacterium]|nr:MAG: DUF2802 domain-containing protein [Halomonadaceae bacterium]